MDIFISRVINEVSQKHSGHLSDLCVVFPTRRACLIFRNRFAASLEKPVWSPGITAIGDFVSKHATNAVSEEIPLLLTLFDVYKRHWPLEGFAKFYAWGQMMINDFDEIDKQLKDPSRIFANLTDLKKIDAAFLPDPSSLKWIHDFLSSMNEEKLTKVQSQFAATWNKLRDIYSDYNSSLNKKKLTYEGKAYQDIVNKLKDGTFISPWKHFVFAGFYGFSRIEEELITRLSSKNDVTVLWDSDNYYIDKKIHEAGYYFRKSPLFKYNPEEKSNFSDFKKKIEITGVPLVAGQAKYTGELLSELYSSGKINLNTTAIILPDENMLFPVLYSLPPEIETINVTMGYPLKQSQYAELLKVLHDLHRNIRVNAAGNKTFFSSHVRRILNHPLFKSKVNPFAAASDSEYLNYLSADDIRLRFGFEDATQVFTQLKTSEDVFQYLINLLRYLRDLIISNSGHGTHFEDKIIEYIISELKILTEHVADHISDIDHETAWQMAGECISGLKIPFSGEPVQGLQIMGFLETRSLDFETLIILNVNEGILPSTTSNKSFIPFSLRKGYGLSTYQDQDASFAYHFYRLLQHASTTYLIYNTEVDKTNGGEPSRFLLQIKQELKKFMGDNLTLTENFITTPLIPETYIPLLIKKDAAVITRLAEFLNGENDIPKRSFSSSSITTYISCSLKFYFRYVAGLYEKETEEISMEDHTFGTILHRVLEKLYQEVKGIVDVNTIDQLLNKADAEVDAAVKEIYKIPAPQLEGSDILMAEVIRELVKRILAADKADVPFEITGLEAKLTANFITQQLNVLLAGSIDRIDESNGIARIIDYKTGQVDLRNSAIDELFVNPDKKALFQLYFYALLYNLNFPNKPVKTGFYIARNLGSGISWNADGNIVQDSDMEKFKNQLSIKLSEILNPEIDFVQTQDIKQCTYCAYKTICSR